MVGDSLDLVIAGERLRLHADRALFWPARQRLLVADLHLGKGDAFRAAGIALPSGGTSHDLQRLGALVRHSGASSLWVLGDLLHGPHEGSRWREGWLGFRQEHPGLAIRLIEGNHDRSAARAALGIELVSGTVADGPFVFAHAPRPPGQAHTEGFRICGHLHPVVRVPGFSGRFPAFAVGRQQLVLPAFSAFTGGWLADPAHTRYGCLQGHLLEIGPEPARP